MRVEHPDRPNFNRAGARRGNASGQLNRIIQIRSVDQVEAAELLLGLGERAVGRRDFSLPNPHSGGGLGSLLRFASDVFTVLLESLGQCAVFPHHRFHLLLWHRSPLAFFVIDQA